MKRLKTAEEALCSLMDRCARSETAPSDVRRLLRRWEIAEAESASILDRLVREHFVDERRYAAAYARDKSRLSRWGFYKIRAGLRMKQIAESVIAEVLAEEVDPQQLREKLEGQLRRKASALSTDNPYQRRNK
ncbi:MAG: regulatory protein RecX, partial [Alistipes sp.]|nr:regulatory protein RecX [Alistipes sp.]